MLFKGFYECFITLWCFYCDLLAPCPTPRLEDHPLSAVRHCLFNIFAIISVENKGGGDTKQTGQGFTTRYKEYSCSFKTYSNVHKFSHHALDNSHAFGNVKDVMDIIQLRKKGHNVNPSKKFYA